MSADCAEEGGPAAGDGRRVEQGEIERDERTRVSAGADLVVDLSGVGWRVGRRLRWGIWEAHSRRLGSL